MKRHRKSTAEFRFRRSFKPHGRLTVPYRCATTPLLHTLDEQNRRTTRADERAGKLGKCREAEIRRRVTETASKIRNALFITIIITTPITITINIIITTPITITIIIIIAIKQKRLRNTYSAVAEA